MKKALISGLILATLLIAPVLVSAQPSQLPEDPATVVNVIDRIEGWIFAILVIGAVIMILVAAFTFLNSAGDPEKTKTARNYVIYALVALVVAFLAQALVNWFGQSLY